MKQFLIFILALALSISGLILVLSEMDEFEIWTFIGVKIVGLAALTVGYWLTKYLD
jgi:hypothetical protein